MLPAKWRNKYKYQFYGLWFDSIGARTISGHPGIKRGENRRYPQDFPLLQWKIRLLLLYNRINLWYIFIRRKSKQRSDSVSTRTKGELNDYTLYLTSVD
jgi:hypothetical protein